MMLVLPNQRPFMRIFPVGLIFCFFPASLISSTYTDKNSPFSRLTNKHSQFGTFSQKELSRIAVPILVLPRDDRTDSVQDEQLGLPCWTMIWAVCVSVDVSKCLAILTLGFLVTSVHLPFFTWVQADTASAACPARPGSLEMISMTFADRRLWCWWSLLSKILRMIQKHPFTMSPRSTTLPLFLIEIEGLTPNFWDDKDPPMTRNELFCPYSLLHRSLLFCFWLSCQLPCPYFLKFSHFSTAAFTSGIFNAWGIGINLCTKLYLLSEFIPFAAMWSSWYLCGTPSNLILIDSSASTIRAYLVLCFQILRQVSPRQFAGVLHGIAAFIGISDFLRAFFMVCLVLMLMFNEENNT